MALEAKKSKPMTNSDSFKEFYEAIDGQQEGDINRPTP
jgi:hypothetical protein